MAFNRNLSRVELGVDPMTGADALFVEGRSVPPDSAFDVGDDVFVFGVATRDHLHDPFVWHGSLKIEAR